MKLFNEGDWVVLKNPSEEERTMFGGRLTFTVERSVELSGGEALYLAGLGQLGLWADRFDILDEDPLSPEALEKWAQEVTYNFKIGP